MLGEFKPLRLIRDVTSQSEGRSVYSPITGRIHDYIGDLPFEIHTLASYRADIYDIREDFAALPWEETQQIAKSLNVMHPTWSETEVPKLLTTSVVISVKTAGGIEHIAFSTVGEKALRADYAHEEQAKLQILTHYWKARAIKHFIVDGTNLPRVMAQNLAQFWLSATNPAGDQTEVTIDSFVKALTLNWVATVPKNELIMKVSKALSVTSEVGESLLGRAVWTRKIDLDLDRVIRHRLPLPLST